MIILYNSSKNHFVSYILLFLTKRSNKYRESPPTKKYDDQIGRIRVHLPS